MMYIKFSLKDITKKFFFLKTLLFTLFLNKNSLVVSEAISETVYNIKNEVKFHFQEFIK